ncbi:MAG: hypothetical protein ACRDZN_15760 [Acidimicrobiales bacterium]
MEPTNDGKVPPDRGNALRRWGPIVAIGVVVAVVAGISLAGGGGEGDGGTTADDSSTDTAPAELPAGVVTWSAAERDGTVDEQDWPEGCDTESGMVAIPFYFRTECVADVADNGGATSGGVTGDTITVVAWLPAANDPIRSLLLSRLGYDETNDELRQQYEGFAEIFQSYYQTYGRRVELKFLEASGNLLDNTAARADAVKVDEELGAFAVLGGPILAGAWADELHARGIVCVACPSKAAEPSSFALTMRQGQARTHFVEYVTKKLAGKPAAFAGDELRSEERVFGHLALGMSDSDERNAEDLKDELADEGVELVEQAIYPLDLTGVSEQAVSAITRMKQAGVTTILLQGDPLSLVGITSEATKQEYFPEWAFQSGANFVDTVAFARSFDQRQWEHAFGISFLPPLTDPDVSPPNLLYEWFHDEPPPADDTVSLLLTYPQVALLFTGLEYAGPNLTVETFRDGLFVAPPTPPSVSQPSVDYGEGIWQKPDYSGVDDMVEMWWDPEAEGPDETGAGGTGMYRYVDGGKRTLPDDRTDDLKLFDPEGAVSEITELPSSEVPPDYPSPAAG